MLDRIRTTLGHPPGTRATLRTRPHVLLYSLRTARLPLVAFALTVLFLTIAMPPVHDALLKRVLPDQSVIEKVGAIFGGEDRGERREFAAIWLAIIAWIVGNGFVLTLFWVDLPHGLKRAARCSRQRQDLAAKVELRNVHDGLKLYDSALRLAIDPERISELTGRIAAIQAQNEDLNDENVIAGRYRILDTISRGGNGVVYRAKDLNLERIVALKELAVTVVTREDRDRFRQEARALAHLSHPNIVQVYDLLEHGGRMWIAMELIDGGNLSDYIAERGQLDSSEATRLASAIATAIEFAHGRGIIHRDIKAMNVLLTKTGQVKVADFGTAKLASSSLQTVEGSIMGSPHCMSPEQVRGETIDERSDVYSLGIVLYQMLLGRPPFTGEMMAVLAQHLQVPPPPVHAQDDSPQMPASLSDLVMQMLAKDPHERPADMHVVRDRLAHVVDAVQV
jgi:hypothetical protein